MSRNEAMTAIAELWERSSLHDLGAVGRLGALALCCMIGTDTIVWAQQTAIPRIDLMPNFPSPYHMRDWKGVVLAYDSLIFQEGSSGQYLPLVQVVPNGVNYPSYPAFLLHSYVGTTNTSTSEAVNALPALVGATLAGHDMRTFFGRDWVTMSRDWFNNRPAENVYLNSPSSSSGDDWWYDTMPNVFFYHLYSLYPAADETQRQFRSVADRWLAALSAMGGSTTPWSAPGVSHRAWHLATMTADDSGVPEPEAAGALGWIMYTAYKNTGDARYRIGAEWALEAMNALSTNPSYELQLSYGALTAAKMNAELGTTYDIAKLLGWCFDVGPLRSWGAVVGTWGGLECSGLIGEVNSSNNYAFAMNTFQQIGALAPIARYDERFARALGKWVLNAANASRLFYSAYLPDSLQDGETWARTYDPHSVIAHEALRQSMSGASPYSTGDAIAGGWAATNFSLYSASSVGYAAAVIDTTDVTGILRLDLLRTDFSHAPAYPTFLFYNPDSQARSISLAVGDNAANVYDLVSNANLATLVSGTVPIQVPSDAAVVAVIVPADASVTYSEGRMMAGGIVVDYHSASPAGNRQPRIKALDAAADTVVGGQTIEIFCTATDPDLDTLAYSWSATAGPILGSPGSTVWQAPDSAQIVVIRCTVTDRHGGTASDSLTITVVERINFAPVIQSMTADPRRLMPGDTAEILCSASDANGDSLSYTWSASSGTILGTGATATWTAPGSSGNAAIRCTVQDTFGGVDVDSIMMMVRTASAGTGSLIAFYPCDGNALDASGFGRNGIASALTPATDGWGRPSRALLFNGSTSSIRVPADSTLNCRTAITVAFWMKVGGFPPREQYPVSHGNWTNRWKVSISNQRVRWTVKTSSGVKDLDSESTLVLDSLVHVTVRYDGVDMEIYLNGKLDAFTSWTGEMLTTSIDLTIGQALPTDNAYGFIGILDEVRIYNYGLAPEAIAALPGIVTSVVGQESSIPTQHRLLPNVPNPFNPSTLITYDLAHLDDVRLTVVDLLGRTIAVLDEGKRAAGKHSLQWDASSGASGVYVLQLQTSEGRAVRKMVYIR